MFTLIKVWLRDYDEGRMSLAQLERALETHVALWQGQATVRGDLAMSCCQHARVQRYNAVAWQTLVCLDCDHTWDEHPGVLEFTQGGVSSLAFVLLLPRDERSPEWAGFFEPEARCACGHYGDNHDFLGGCVVHDADGPCPCAGFQPKEKPCSN